ncbi:hypothetical protein Tco_1509059 [Tanacetum coccineum]
MRGQRGRGEGSGGGYRLERCGGVGLWGVAGKRLKNGRQYVFEAVWGCQGGGEPGEKVGGANSVGGGVVQGRVGRGRGGWVAVGCGGGDRGEGMRDAATRAEKGEEGEGHGVSERGSGADVRGESLFISREERRTYVRSFNEEIPPKCMFIIGDFKQGLQMFGTMSSMLGRSYCATFVFVKEVVLV